MPTRRAARAAALIAAAAGLASAWMLAVAAHWPLPTAPALAGLTVAHTAIAWWRTRPAIALTGVLLGLGAALAATGMAVTLPSILLAPAALYAACAHGRRPAFTTTVVPLATVAVTLRLGAEPGLAAPPALIALATAAVLTTGCALGLWHRAQRTTADQKARTAAAEERARIAAEMHDVVAHSLAVIIRQADGARYLAASDPASGALAVIATTARDALADTRGVLGVLDPVAGTDGIPALLDRVRAAGLDVHETVTGDTRPLTPAAELALYRLVQEALTNVMRHGDGPARLTMTWADALEIRIANPAPDRPHTPGRGLTGMRARVTAAGGTLEAGPGPHGFAVRARLPYGGAS